MKARINPRNSAKIFSILRESILRLELRPGLVLDEAYLCEKFNVSRTPVREAIIQLVSEGLVIRDGRRARIAPIDFEELPELFDALLIASRLVNSMAATNRTDSQLSAIHDAMVAFEKSIESGDSLKIQDANLEFHMAISNAAKNRNISSFYERMLVASSRLANACFSGSPLLEAESSQFRQELTNHYAETMRQHRQIYEAIRDRDADRADEMAILHQKLYSDRLQTTIFASNPNVKKIKIA